MPDLVSLIRQAAQPRGTYFIHDLALVAADEIERLRSFPREKVARYLCTESGDTWAQGRTHWLRIADGVLALTRDSDGSGEAGQTAKQAEPKATARAEGIAK